MRGRNGGEFGGSAESWVAASQKDSETDPTSKCSGGHSLVTMVKAAEDRDGDDLALVGGLDFPGDRAVAVKRSVRSSGVIVFDVLRHDALEMSQTHYILDSDRSLHRGIYFPVWLLEEPESFLHADIAVKLGELLNSDEWLESIQRG